MPTSHQQEDGRDFIKNRQKAGLGILLVGTIPIGGGMAFIYGGSGLSGQGETVTLVGPGIPGLVLGILLGLGFGIWFGCCLYNHFTQSSMILGIVSTVTALAWGILQLDALREWRIYAEYIAILMAVWGVVWAICIVARFKRTGESKQLTGPQP